MRISMGIKRVAFLSTALYLSFLETLMFLNRCEVNFFSYVLKFFTLYVRRYLSLFELETCNFKLSPFPEGVYSIWSSYCVFVIDLSRLKQFIFTNTTSWGQKYFY